MKLKKFDSKITRQNNKLDHNEDKIISKDDQTMHEE